MSDLCSASAASQDSTAAPEPQARMEWHSRALPSRVMEMQLTEGGCFRSGCGWQTRVLINLHNKKKSKMNDEEAEGSCPNKKKAMILAWSHIRQNVEKVFMVTVQNTNVINLENTKINGQMT